MSTIFAPTGLRQTAAPAHRFSRLFRRWLDALAERRQRQALRAALFSLSERDLQDFGMTREEIDYVALNGGRDPRCARVDGRPQQRYR
jgi:uncharacterized protein YjiS (DUF1127 family)